MGEFLQSFRLEEMDRLEKKWKHLKLTEAEGEEISVNEMLLVDEAKREEFSLEGKLLVERTINKEVIRSTISKVWKTTKPITLYDINPNLFIFSFENIEDKLRVLKGRP